MISRQWYPQLDIYDTIRRMTVLLKAFEIAPGVERLCIADFFLANPPLLHKTTMPFDVRNSFKKLEVIRPEKSYVTLPAPQLLFHRMAPVQRQALTELRGRELVDMELFAQGKVTLTPAGHDVFATGDLCLMSESELSRFLTQKLLAPGAIANTELRSRTGLHRML